MIKSKYLIYIKPLLNKDAKMNKKTKNTGILKNSIKNLMIFLILVASAAAVSGADDVTIDVSFDDSSIDVGDDAILFVEIENEENDDINDGTIVIGRNSYWGFTADPYQNDGTGYQLPFLWHNLRIDSTTTTRSDTISVWIEGAEYVWPKP